MERLSVEEVADVVESEGLGYAIQSYMGPSHIADPELAQLWTTARAALASVESYLEEHTDDDGESPDAGGQDTGY